ncbi:flagellar protein FlhE [Erwinia typographi]|uniref:flagellar protein FlhE n=1 Tax=Erwinia typographi TaxID=371042 RepID=UPI0022B682D1|nr:flagellar protein FlhE [Erwinia typographi]
MRRLLLTLLLIPALVQAGSGSWSKKSAGGTVSTGGQIMMSQAINAPLSVPDGASTSRISWRIQLLNPLPPGLEIKLCDERHCLPLDALSGQKNRSVPFSPRSRYRFIYSVNSAGTLSPALNVVSNQLTLNYRW